ncbi:hypothetical protein TNCV_3155681 [Trichonephila clavipes]|nr:hypothetical protein TNCV_3155681 [Trichonephila clavipes]
MSMWAIFRRVLRAEDCFADATSRNKSPERILRIVLTCPMLMGIAFSIRKGFSSQFVAPLREKLMDSGLRWGTKNTLGSMTGSRARPDQPKLYPFLCHHGFLPVPSRTPPGHEFPHFSNVLSVTAGGFFKARHRGNTHNVLPGTVQGRSHGGFLNMKESPPPSHPQPSSSSSETAFGRALLGAVTDDARNSSAAHPSSQGSFPLPN